MKLHVRCEEISLSPGSSLTFLKALVEWRLLSELRFCLGESGLQTAAEVGEAVRSGNREEAATFALVGRGVSSMCECIWYGCSPCRNIVPFVTKRLLL